ncbi:MAG: pimeloyl-[acyl-carrier protein] synthase [Actinomycetota bacterium]|jgi:cytochrome P450|nr:pimeloyl-[acyl-carrier protein] synthase [Actinomycetota bacterium]
MTDLASLMVEAGLTSPMLPENRSDPYPTYAFIRRHEPVHHAPDGTWVLTRYDHAAAVLRDPRFSTNPARLGEGIDPATSSPVRQAGSNLMMFLDPPDHTRLRGLVSQAFTPRTVDSLKPRIERLVDELLDAVVERGDGELDVLADLAYPLPTVVICELLGVPVADRESFKGWAAGASRLLDNYLDQAALMEGMAAGMELFRYFSDLVEQRRAHPGPDLLSALLAAEAEGDRLSHAELLSTVTLLFVAGFETTMNLLGNGMLALLRNPSEIDRLRADPSLVRTAVEELIRYDGPVHITARIATTDVEIGGERIREGEQVAVSLGAANRDPEQFPDPDRLDVGRTPNRHLGLGGGPHFCLGATLARIEAQAAFAAVLRRFAHLELATEHPTYRDHFVIRGLTGLKVRITPPAG